MQHKRTWLLLSGAGLLAWAADTASVRAQASGGPYRIDALTVSAGGILNGGAFQLRGTFGQALVGAATAPGYAINAGLLGADDSVFRNGFEYE